MESKKFHIKPDGLPGICNAQPGNCPYGDSDEHYSTKEEAELAADARGYLLDDPRGIPSIIQKAMEEKEEYREYSNRDLEEVADRIATTKVQFYSELKSKLSQLRASKEEVDVTLKEMEEKYKEAFSESRNLFNEELIEDEDVQIILSENSELRRRGLEDELYFYQEQIEKHEDYLEALDDGSYLDHPSEQLENNETFRKLKTIDSIQRELNLRENLKNLGCSMTDYRFHSEYAKVREDGSLFVPDARDYYLIKEEEVKKLRRRGNYFTDLDTINIYSAEEDRILGIGG